MRHEELLNNLMLGEDSRHQFSAVIWRPEPEWESESKDEMSEVSVSDPVTDPVRLVVLKLNNKSPDP